MRYRIISTILALLLAGALGGLNFAAAQATDQEWEYLVVSYGETRFSNPLLSPDADLATYSKVQLFSEIGVTIPNEAINLQRNIDILGMFGWEMVTIVGAIGGDQQVVFKRPYDAERSAAEAERIKAEREKLIDLYNAGQNTSDDTSSDTSENATPKPQLVELDALERAQATDARNRRDEETVRGLVRQAASASGFTASALEATGRATGATRNAAVTIQLRLDVTDAALVAPGQYRRSLVDEAVDEFREALAVAGAVKADAYGYCGFRQPQGEVTLVITPFIQHDGTTTDLNYPRSTHCFED